MSSSEVVTLWFRALADGDELAAQSLWEYCVPQLLRYSRSRLPPNLRKALDEEDVALSAFKSLCNGAQEGGLQSVQNRHELWNLLCCIASRKASGYIKHETRQKRGGGKVRGESIFLSGGNPSTADAPAGGLDNEPAAPVSGMQTGDEIAELTEQCEHLLDSLDDDMLKTIALLRLEGYSVDEIAERIDCAKRSVERRLALIRKIWTENSTGDRE